LNINDYLAGSSKSKTLINSMKIHSSLSIVLEIEKNITDNLAADNKLAICRIIQEQLSNILKHSEATHTSVTLKKFSGKLVVCINDNRLGADSEQRSNGIGLHNIAGRVDMQNGTMEIITAPGKGYLLNIELRLD
jgi:two-component system sensor histidine kinase UhpB